MVCVLCEVRSEVLFVIHTNLILQSIINYICIGIIFALRLLSTSQNSLEDTKHAISFLSVVRPVTLRSTVLHFKYYPKLSKLNLVDDFLNVWQQIVHETEMSLGKKQFQSNEREQKLTLY
jgi:hypothetical protein